jgi:hypothetical protein
METIHKWGSRGNDGLHAFVGQLKQWKTQLNNADFSAYENLFSCTQAGFGAAVGLQDAVAALAAGIDQIVDGIEGFRREQLRESPCPGASG